MRASSRSRLTPILNEMGITSPLSARGELGKRSRSRPIRRRSPIRRTTASDLVAFANFMRATKAPSRGPITPAVQAGEQVFSRIGCAVCHVDSLTTAPAGTSINGGALIVDKALGNKTIHPYSDFLMHDIGTGDGIPIQPTPEFAETANQNPHGPALGAAHAQPADARRTVVYARRGDPPPRRAGGARHRPVPAALGPRSGGTHGVSQFAVKPDRRRSSTFVGNTEKLDSIVDSAVISTRVLPSGRRTARLRGLCRRPSSPPRRLISASGAGAILMQMVLFVAAMVTPAAADPEPAAMRILLPLCSSSSTSSYGGTRRSADGAKAGRRKLSFLHWRWGPTPPRTDADTFARIHCLGSAWPQAR